MRLIVGSTWDGRPLEEPAARIDVDVDSDVVQIEVDAPFHDDPPPPFPPGACPRLWEHEVVEVFLLGADEHYLEVELGPHGHHLVLSLVGRRNIRAEHVITFVARRRANRWNGTATFGSELLPRGLSKINAYAVFGPPAARTYAACGKVPGPSPDFHQLEHFLPWAR